MLHMVIEIFVFGVLCLHRGARGVVCGPAPAIANGHWLNPCFDSIFMLCHFVCDVGYTASAPTYTSCRTTSKGTVQWSTPGNCTPTRCRELPPIANGSWNQTCEEVIDSNCSFVCNHGYVARGVSTVWCRSDSRGIGDWTESGSCQLEKGCDDPPRVLNGYWNTSSDHSVGSVCHLVCDDNFTIDGSSNITCVEDLNGTLNWSAPGACKTIYNKQGPQLKYVKISKDELSCPKLGSVKHGLITSPCHLAPGSVCTITCDRDYTLVGNKSIMCYMTQENVLKWSDAGTCTDHPSRAPDLKAVPARRLHDIPPGTTAHSVVPVKSVDDRPSRAPDLKAVPARRLHGRMCGMVPNIEHGAVDHDCSKTLGGACNVTCDMGYVIRGERFIDCQKNVHGAWVWIFNGACISDGCFDTPRLKNGYFTNSEGKVGQQSLLICEDGYVIDGPETISCLRNENNSAQWTEHGICKFHGCSDPPSVNNGNWTYSKVKAGAVSNLSCDAGYAVEGPTDIECIRIDHKTMEWTTPGSCRYTKCDDPPKLVLGEWKEPCNPLVGSICKLLCPDNYLVKGEMFIVCRESHHNSNNWSTPGVCQFNASNKTSTKDVSENIILETGTNHSLNECQFGWFGHRCMYRDLTLMANGVFPSEILINGKCVEDTFIVVYFRKAVYFESIIMTFYKVIPSYRIYKFVSNKTTAGECREIFEYPQNTYTLALECQLVEPVNQITVYFKQPAQICEFNINGGRNIMMVDERFRVKKPVELTQTSSINMPTDANTNDQNCFYIWKQGEEAMWGIQFLGPKFIHQMILFTSGKIKRIMKNVSVEIYDTEMRMVYEHRISNLSSNILNIDIMPKREAFRIVIKAYEFLSLCEVQAFGACLWLRYGTECDNICSITCLGQNCRITGECKVCEINRYGDYCLDEYDKKVKNETNSKASPILLSSNYESTPPETMSKKFFIAVFTIPCCLIILLVVAKSSARKKAPITSSNEPVKKQPDEK